MLAVIRVNGTYIAYNTFETQANERQDQSSPSSRNGTGAKAIPYGSMSTVREAAADP